MFELGGCDSSFCKQNEKKKISITNAQNYFNTSSRQYYMGGAMEQSRGGVSQMDEMKRRTVRSRTTILPNIVNMLIIFLLIIPLVTSDCNNLRQSNYILDTDNKDLRTETLQICTNKENACCTREVEEKIYANAEKRFQSELQEKVLILRQLIQSNTNSLKTYFYNALNSCHTQLDLMFKRTYGPFYETNSIVFDIFFNRLRAFSSPYSDVSVEQLTNDMFHQLFQIVFSLLNPLTHISDDQSKCMANIMDDIAPFGDMPTKIINHLKKVLTSWKQFVSSLETANEVLRGFMNVTLSKECIQNLARMSDCSMCSGQSQAVKPCSNFCQNVLKGCLAEWSEMDQQWNHVVGGLAKMSHMLGNTHNIHHTLTPLPVQLSEAVMTFQEKGASITNKVLARCFEMDSEMLRSQETSYMVVRGRRSASWMKDVLETDENQWKILQQLMSTFSDRMLSAKGWFKKLPETLCSDSQLAADDATETCWNGTAIAHYTYSLASDGISQQSNNLEYQKERRLSYFGLFVEERLRMGILSFKIYSSLNGKNYSSYELDSSASSSFFENDDEDYIDGSGDDSDLSIINIISPDDIETKQFSEKYASASAEVHIFLALLLFSFLITTD